MVDDSDKEEDDKRAAPTQRVEFWLDVCMRDAPGYLRAKGLQRLERRARTWLGEQLARVHDMDFAGPFCQARPVEGAGPADYLQRVDELEPDLHVLSGIRFRGGDLAFPFVDILATTRPLETCLEQVLAHVRRTYSVFRPVAIRIFVACAPAEATLPVGAELDMVFCAADLAQVAQAEVPPLGADLRLTAVGESELEACEREVLAAYDEFREDDARLAAMVPPANLEHLRDCYRTGYLARIEDAASGRCVGVFGVHADEDWLFDEYCVCEEVLRRSHRGRGLAARVQREAAGRALAAGRSGMLWGTIHADNVASRRTALRAGRPEVAAWAFVPLDRES